MSNFLDKFKFPALFSVRNRWEKRAGDFNLSKKLLTNHKAVVLILICFYMTVHMDRHLLKGSIHLWELSSSKLGKTSKKVIFHVMLIKKTLILKLKIYIKGKLDHSKLFQAKKLWIFFLKKCPNLTSSVLSCAH